jgi:SnoaL-like domain
MAAATEAGVASAFSAAMRERDFEALDALLADDVVLRSPITARFQFEGHAQVIDLMRTVRESFEELGYASAVDGEDESILIFNAVVGGQELEGVDVLRTDEHGRIQEIIVFVRPLMGIAAFGANLAPRLARKRSRTRAVLAKVLVGPLVLFNRVGDAIGVWLAKPQ